MSRKNDFRVVWSDDPRDRAQMEKPKARDEAVPPAWSVVFRLEKGGRGGKTVTVLDQLPKNEEFLKALCKELKAKCGSGGTYSREAGTVEIQGDKREMIKGILDKKGVKYRGM